MRRLQNFQTSLGVQGKKPLLFRTKTWQPHKHSYVSALFWLGRGSLTHCFGGNSREAACWVDTRCTVLDHQQVLSCRLAQSQSVAFRNWRERDEEEKRPEKPSYSLYSSCTGQGRCCSMAGCERGSQHTTFPGDHPVHGSFVSFPPGEQCLISAQL